MGCSFELGLIASDAAIANQYLEQGIREIKRIENLLSEFKPDSQISIINQHAGEATVHVDNEVVQLLHRSQKISSISNGYFDITVGPLKKMFRFKNEAFVFPAKHSIAKALKKVGYRKISIDPETNSVKLNSKGMHISLAAIGKGYAADVVRKMWKENNVIGGYIDASGDLTAFGHDEKGEPWKIGIANPDNRNETLLTIPLHEASVATSGDYEQHFIHNGSRYSHNINPKDGKPIKGIKSVSIVSPSAELSDALATAVYAMGIDKGLCFLNQLPKTHGIIINDQNKIFFTKQLHYEAVSV